MLSSRLSFGGSENYLARLDDLFVDDLVYIDQWRTFVSTCLEDWRGSLLGVRNFAFIKGVGTYLPANLTGVFFARLSRLAFLCPSLADLRHGICILVHFKRHILGSPHLFARIARGC